MTYHPSLLKFDTRERTIEAQQTSTYTFSEGESLMLEAKSLEMVLNGQPPAALRERCEQRLAVIRAQLAGYPCELFLARRAWFIEQIKQHDAV